MKSSARGSVAARAARQSSRRRGVRGPLTRRQRDALLALDRCPRTLVGLASDLWGEAATRRHARPAGRVVAPLRAQGLVVQLPNQCWCLDYDAFAAAGLRVSPGHLTVAMLDGWPLAEIEPGRWREVHRECGEAMGRLKAVVEWRWERGPNSICTWCQEPLPPRPSDAATRGGGHGDLFGTEPT